MGAAGVWVGIEVNQAQLDLALGAAGELVTVAHDQQGIAALLARWGQLAVARVLVEATGGVETALVAALGAAGLPVVVIIRARSATARGGNKPRPLGRRLRSNLVAAAGVEPATLYRPQTELNHQHLEPQDTEERRQ